jgi:uncharacterized protein DUF397
MSQEVPCRWTRSPRCDSNACVEVADVDGAVVVRNSKKPAGPTLAFSREAWKAFLAGVKHGDFDF